jgi:hypothetical protein
MGPNTKASALSLFLVNSRKKSLLAFYSLFSERWLASRTTASHTHTHTQSLSLCSIKSSAALASAFSPALFCILFVYRRISCSARSSESQTSSPSSPCVYLLSALNAQPDARGRRNADTKEWSVRKVEKSFKLMLQLTNKMPNTLNIYN